MKIHRIELMAIWLFLFVISIQAQTTAFNYQGKLDDGGNPANGTYQLQFALFDAEKGGNQIGNTISDVAVTAANGVFSTKLDFGANVFTGENRFLEISVRRNANENYTTLNPRERIVSSPYSIRTLSAQQADLALDSQKLGGLDASEYVNASTINSTFIRNSTTLQTGNFNINGNGFVGGNLGIGTTNPFSKLSVQTNGYGITQTNGTVTVGTFLTTGSGWIGTRSNHPLQFFTNDGGGQMTLVPTGEIGMGVTPQTGIKLDVLGVGRFQTPNGNIQFGTPNGETGITFTNTNRADIRYDAFGLKLLANTGTGIPSNANGIVIRNSGNVTIGSVSIFNDLAKLTIANDGSNNALATFGDVYVNGNIRNLFGFGAVQAMIEVDRNGAILRCYNGTNGSTTLPCGFSVTLPLGNVGAYRIDFGFSATGRFFSITPRYASTCNVIPIQCRNAGANYVVNGQYLEVFTFNANNAADTAEAAFMVIVY